MMGVVYRFFGEKAKRIDCFSKRWLPYFRMKKTTPEQTRQISALVVPLLSAWNLIPPGHIVSELTFETINPKQVRHVRKKRHLTPKRLDAFLAQSPEKLRKLLLVQTANALVNAGFMTVGDLARELQKTPLCLKAKGCGPKKTMEVTNVLLSQGVPLDQKLPVSKAERANIRNTSFKNLVLRSRLWLGFDFGFNDRFYGQWDTIKDFISDDKKGFAIRSLESVNATFGPIWLTSLRRTLKETDMDL